MKSLHAIAQKKWKLKNPDYEREWKKMYPKYFHQNYLKIKNDPVRYALRKYYSLKTRCSDKSRHTYFGKTFMSRKEWNLFVQKTINDICKLHAELKDANFDMRKCPSIDRIDVSHGYEIENCRWITHSKNSSLGNIKGEN